jgi:oxygen-independent coproporphyrinogen-3 oxidase
LHIPFCKQACTYCNFHFSTSLRYKDDLIHALVKEIELEKNYLEDAPVETVYFGGGTPSILQTEEVSLLIEAIQRNFNLIPGAEITLEANPDDINPEKLKQWRNAGINRLSIGIQSFFEEELKWMNRAHDFRQAHACIEQSLKEGFDNFSIDLIYGSPLLTDEMWKQNVDKALSYGIKHLSCYALTVEEKTPLEKQISLSQKHNIDNDRQARQFLLLMQWLGKAGYEHYEVSNFAMPGFKSRHNSSYWKGIPYLGIGPSAHSYNGSERRWNLANNNLYIRSIQQGTVSRESEILTDDQNLNEYIMISLRTMEGMDLDLIENKWGKDQRQRIEKGLIQALNDQWIILSNSLVQLTDEGMLRADLLAGSLFK